MNEENASLSSPIFLSLSISLTLYLSLFISLSYAFLPFSFVGNAPSDDKEELLGKRLSFCRRKDEKDERLRNSDLYFSRWSLLLKPQILWVRT